MGKMNGLDENEMSPGCKKKHYWSFPEFKEISTAVLKSQRHNIDGSMGDSSAMGRDARINTESMLEYVNFPDP